MFGRIPIDIVEMVIVSSDTYDLFKSLQEILSKLQESQRVSRINDKLTHFENRHYGINYTLNNKLHREYNKPRRIYNNGEHDYGKYGKRERNIGCVNVHVYGRLFKNEIHYKHVLDIKEMCFIRMYTECYGKIDNIIGKC